jgi:heme exporter protein A
LALDRELPLRRALCFWIGPNRATERLDDALTTLNLADLASVLVRLLSTGQLKRAALARVAASTARLWLLDEPANGLDAASFDAFALLMEAHTADGGAIIAASHVPLPGTWRTLELGR